MAATRLWRMDRARNGEHLAALLGGQPGGDERARLHGGLDHQRALRQPGNEAVALRKIGGQRRRAQAVFAHQGAAHQDAVRQIAVVLGVDTVQPGAHHRDGGRVGIERALVGRAVHTQGQPRHHAHTGLAQRTRKLPRIGLTLRRGVAAAHHGQAARVVQGVQLPGHVQQQRRVGHVQQFGRKTGVAQGDHMAVGRFGQPVVQAGQGGVEFGGRAQQGLCGLRTHHRPQGERALLEHRLGQAKSGQQFARRHRTNARREQQAQPTGEFVADHGGCAWPRFRGW